MDLKQQAEKVEKCFKDIRTDLKKRILSCAGDDFTKEAREKQTNLTIKKWSNFYGLNHSNIKTIYYGRAKSYKRNRKTIKVYFSGGE